MLLSRQAAVETGCGIGVFLADVAAERPGLRRVLAAHFGQHQQVWLCAHAELRRSASMRVVWERLESRLRAPGRPIACCIQGRGAAALRFLTARV